MMNAKTKLAAAVISAMVLGACSNGDDVVGINSDCSNLSGVFTATSATVTGTGTGNNSTVNLLADGSSFDLTLGVTAFSSSYRQGTSGTPLTTSGTLTTPTDKSITIGQQLFTNGAANTVFNCSIKDNTLTLEAPKSSFTFDGQSDETPADVKIVLKKTSE
jgi:hypothetical protein